MKPLMALKSFEFPASLRVRDAIRRWHRQSKNDGVPYPGDRGESVEVVIGEFLTAPDDLLQSWLDAGLVEEVL